MLLGLGGRLPAGERVGEVDAGALVGSSAKGAPRSVQQHAELQVATTNGAGRISKPKTRLMAACFRSLATSASSPFSRSVCGDLVQHLDEVGAGAAAGVEHDDARVGEAVGDVQLLAQHRVDARDHVLHDLRRRVPDAELLAQLGVERLEERLVEVLDGVALLEGCEEGGAVDAVERLRGPVEDLVEAAGRRAASGLAKS